MLAWNYRTQMVCDWNKINKIIFIVYPITTFLELNPNIRSFEINSTNHLENGDSLKGSEVTLDDLSVRIDMKHTRRKYFAPICRLLNELHELGLYNRLKLYISIGFKQRLMDEVGLCKHWLNFTRMKLNMVLSHYQNCEQLKRFTLQTARTSTTLKLWQAILWISNRYTCEKRISRALCR